VQSSKKSKRFSAIIDAFNNEIKLTQTNRQAPGYTFQKAIPPSVLGSPKMLGLDLHSMQDVECGNLLMIEEGDINMLSNGEKSSGLLRQHTRKSQGSGGVESSPRTDSLTAQSVVTQKKARQLERDKKRLAAVAGVQVQIAKWKRLLEPVFSGSVNPEVNRVPNQKSASLAVV